jgi:hypothetical protein
MSSDPTKVPCEGAEMVCLLAIDALPPEEQVTARAHIASCSRCRDELQTLGIVVDSFISWPTDVLRPPEPLWARVANRIAEDTDGSPLVPTFAEHSEPEWEEVVPGISCKILSDDTQHGNVSMLVRLQPGVHYPPHTHAGKEQLYLLDGELWIDDRKLYPGDFNQAEPGTSDRRVWSETGCTCLLITSARDLLA